MFRKSIAALALGAACLAFVPAAHAHGSTKPRHGGIVQIVGETSFELATPPSGVELYLLDEGEEIASSGIAAKLNVVDKSGAKSEVPLNPAGGNKLEARGVTIPKGSKVVVMLTDKATQAKTSASFTID